MMEKHIQYENTYITGPEGYGEVFDSCDPVCSENSKTFSWIHLGLLKYGMALARI